ncbi:MAG: flippase [Clostridium sp.]|nr:flippase [Clostridium sp.]
MSRENPSLKLNMVLNAIFKLSSLLFPLITFPYVSRILLPEGTGKVTFALSVVSYFSMFTQLGIPTYGIRACAKVRDDKEELSRTVHELLLINLCCCVLVYLVYAAAVLLVPRFSSERLLFTVVGLNIGLNAIGAEWLYNALEKYRYITARSVAFQGISLVLMFLLIRTREDYVCYGALLVLATSASYVLNFCNLRKYIYIHPVGGYDLRRHLQMIFVFFSLSVATTIYTNLDNVMLGFMKDDAAVGLYSTAVKVKSLLVSLVTSASAVLLPRASYYVDKGMFEEFYGILKKMMHLILVISFPMALYFMVFAREGVVFLAGPAFEGSVLPMRIIMPTLVLIGVTNVMGIQMLVPLGRETSVLHAVTAGAAVDVILNGCLIPRFSSSGAAIGTLAAETAVLFVQLYAIRTVPVRLFAGIPLGKLLAAMVLAVLASAWTLLVFDGPFLILLVSCICFFGVYGMALFLMKEPLVSVLLRRKNRQERSCH